MTINQRITDWIIGRSNNVITLDADGALDIGNWTGYRIVLDGIGKAAGIKTTPEGPDCTHVVCIIDDNLIIDQLRDSGRDPVRTIIEIHRIHVDDTDADTDVVDWWEGHIATPTQCAVSDAEPGAGMILIDINTGGIVTPGRPEARYALRVWVD